MSKKASAVTWGESLRSQNTNFMWTNVSNLSSLEAWHRARKGGVRADLPPSGTATTMICFEVVLFCAVKSGALTLDGLFDLYDKNLGADKKPWYSVLDGTWVTGPKTYNLASHDPMPECGDIVFFNQMGHVALAKGTRNANNEAEVLSFWGLQPIPTPTGGMSVQTGIDNTTIEALATTIQTTGPTFVSGAAFNVAVTFVAPPW
jgi:hypothetical protein